MLTVKKKSEIGTEEQKMRLIQIISSEIRSGHKRFHRPDRRKAESSKCVSLCEHISVLYTVFLQYQKREFILKLMATGTHAVEMSYPAFSLGHQ